MLPRSIAIIRGRNLQIEIKRSPSVMACY